MSQLYQKHREPNYGDHHPAESELPRKDERSPQRGSPNRKTKSLLSTPSIDVRISRRKPTPSPLHTVQSSTSPTVDAGATSIDSKSLPFPRPATNHPPSTQPPYDQPPDSPEQIAAPDEQSEKNPEERELQHGQKEGARPSTPVREGHNEQGSGLLEPSPFSTPSDRSAAASPSGRYSKMVASALSHHSEAWTEVRKSSIDSAISSIFSQASSSRKSSQDSVTTSLTDIANLSSAAGSPEAAIQYLLREKHQSAVQNAQLWRLVDKQRTMILGLNRDLERALHDKERYRKKLKEHLGLQAGGSNVKAQERAAPKPQQEDAFPTGNRSHDVSLRECKADDQSTRPAKEIIRSAHGLTPPASRESSASERDGGSRREKTGTLTRSAESARMVAAPLSPQDSESTGEARTLSPEEPSPTSQKEDEGSWRRGAAEKQFMDPVDHSSDPPAFTLSEPSPVSEQTPGPALSSRKAPPAPLNLGLSKPATVRLQPLGPDDHSGSEYDDAPEVSQVPTFERGRRRTREDDDRVREAISLQEQERRSRSKKEKSGNSASGKSSHKISEQRVAPIPITDQPPLDDSHSCQNSESSSIQLPQAELLSPLPLAPRHLQPEITSSGTTLRALAPSPLSPGLPMSPRPTDRPMNSPKPRLPKESAGLASLGSPLLSPQFGIPGLPVSPRALKQGLSFPPGSPMPLASPGIPKSFALGSASGSGTSPPRAENKNAESKEADVELRECESPTSTVPSGNNSSYLLGPNERMKKEGYLTKRGKNFGGWKTRFFSLDGPKLRYYEMPGGPHLGTIRIRNAQIGKQSEQLSNHSPGRGNDNEVDREHRYGFSILEPKKKDSSSYVRHYLCAESISERDEWVLALMHYLDDSGSENEHSLNVSKRIANDKKERNSEHGKKYSLDKESPPISQDGGSLLGLSYEDTIQAEAPIRGSSSRSVESPPSPTRFHSSGSVQRSQISGPTNGAVIQDLEAWGNKPQTSNPVDKKEQKKRSIWGFKSRASSDLNTLLLSSHTSNISSAHHIGRNGPSRTVFGAPLAEATEISQPVGVDVYLPAVVYRCIEYLDAKEAAKEEGIFRLSGSSLVIKSLRERFNHEGDVNFLVEDQYYDVHAVASLLKMYLRELPASVLTRELHLDFLHVIELDSKEKKVDALRLLVHKLPRANHSLLRALSAFLITIVDNSVLNKMTVRNVGIVFSPTLNIPAPVLSMFLMEFTTIFGGDPEETMTGNLASVEIAVPAATTTSTEIRSPRRQMFQDLPTPAYNQSSFPKTPRSINPPSQFSGFAPIQISHEQPRFGQPLYPNSQNPPITVGGQEYGSLNGALAPNHGRDIKAKRRESSMFLQSNHRTNSATRAHGTSGIVEEESSSL